VNRTGGATSRVSTSLWFSEYKQSRRTASQSAHPAEYKHGIREQLHPAFKLVLLVCRTLFRKPKKPTVDCTSVVNEVKRLPSIVMMCTYCIQPVGGTGFLRGGMGWGYKRFSGTLNVPPYPPCPPLYTMYQRNLKTCQARTSVPKFCCTLRAGSKRSQSTVL
jgi:hypothetical protein